MTNYSFFYRGVDASTRDGFSVSYSNDARQSVLITTPDVADGINVLDGEQENTFLFLPLATNLYQQEPRMHIHHFQK